MLTIACAKPAIPLFQNHVAPQFYQRTLQRLRVDELTDRTKLRGQDLIVVPRATLRQMIKSDPGSIAPLGGYQTFLASCGGGVGGFGGRPFEVAGGIVAGLQLTAGDTDVPELPDFLDFLTDRTQRLVIAATSRRVLKSANRAKFFALENLVAAIEHFMPMVSEFQAQHQLSLGRRTGRSSQRPQDPRLKVSLLKRSGKNAAFALSFTNTSDKPIKRLQAFFFNARPTAFKNAHAHVRFETRVNTVGPVAAYAFGDLRPGDTITRRIEYDFSDGDTLSVGWSPSQAARMNDGGGWGNGCSTTKPEPIPDPFPAFAAATCYDAGCSKSHCPEHECKQEGDGCGCFTKG